LYLRLPQGSLAPRNSTAPLGAVVLLDRRPRGPASLSEASRSATLQALIVRNFARAAPAGDLLERLHRVMDRLPRFTLHYSDLDEAASLLEATFSAWPPRIGALASADPPLSVVDISSDGAATRARLAGVRLKQNPAVKLHAVDGELFLADAEGTAIHHLNAIGAGLWNLLADAIDEVEAVEVLCGAFPAVERAMVARDVRELFDALAAGGFIVETLPPADCNGTGIPS
ncbi:MAG: PqqD family protein, partial [Xanthobacteraceae bacterium]